MIEAYNALLVNALVAGATIAAGVVLLVVAISIILLALLTPAALYAWIRDRLNPPPDRAEALRVQISNIRRREFLKRRAKRAAKHAAA